MVMQIKPAVVVVVVVVERDYLGEKSNQREELYCPLSSLVTHHASLLFLLHLFTKCNIGFFIFRLSLCIPITFRDVQRSCLSSPWSSNQNVG